jgi:hypothetical protein
MGMWTMTLAWGLIGWRLWREPAPLQAQAGRSTVVV